MKTINHKIKMLLLLCAVMLVACEKGDFGGANGRVHTNTIGVTDITSITAIGYGEVTVEGKSLPDNFQIVGKGLIYGTDSSFLKIKSHSYNAETYYYVPFSNSATVLNSGTGNGRFECSLKNLKSGTKYYVRAYSHISNDLRDENKNSSKTFNKYLYGNIMEFISEDSTVSVPIAVTGISLDKTALTLDVGDNYTLTATVLPANATDRTVTWTSSDNGKVTVDNNGKVTAIAAGAAIITAQAGEKTVTCLVTVNATIAVTDISLDRTTLTLAISDNYTLTATVLPANATDRTVTWTSSDNTKVSVNNTGTVTAIAEGTVDITAQAGDKTAICNVTVKFVPQNGVLINDVIWAKCNVDMPGTFAATPESAGKFYQWNRKVAWAATGAVTGWDTSIPTGDNWAAANDPSPAGWRVPTNAEIQTLLNTAKVSNVWTTQNGINGRQFTDISTGKSIFIPAAGYRRFDNGTLYGSGTMGYYWNSRSWRNYTYFLNFHSGSATINNSTDKRNGFSVRSVAE